jgi:hypothetical protein
MLDSRIKTVQVNAKLVYFSSKKRPCLYCQSYYYYYQKYYFYFGIRRGIRMKLYSLLLLGSVIFLSACGQDVEDNPDPAKDGTAPKLFEIIPVTNPTADLTPHYTFKSTESGTVSYFRNGVPVANAADICASTTTRVKTGINVIRFSELALGLYDDCQLTVTDKAGNVSELLNVSPFEIKDIIDVGPGGGGGADLSPPILIEITPVPALTNDTTPTYQFGSSEAGNIFYAGGCSAPTEKAVAGVNTVTFDELRSITYGSCTIRVRDAAGNYSAPLAVSAFTVDAIAPVLRTVIRVPAISGDTTPDFTFSSSEAGFITYSGDCSSVTSNAVVGNNTVTFNPLLEGPHTNCRIAVTDSIGNRSELLDVDEFRIDLTPPVLRVVTQVPVNGNDPTPRFTFVTNESGTLGYTGACSSVDTFAGDGENFVDFDLNPSPVSGAVSFYTGCALTVTDVAGNTSIPLVVNDFQVDLQAPTLTEVTRIGTNPLYGTTDTTPDYTFNTDEGGELIYVAGCSAVPAIATTGDNTITFDELRQATYTFCTVRIRDAAGNVSAPLTVSPFTVDSIPPVLRQVSPVPIITADNTPAYTFNSTESGTITYIGNCSSTVAAVAGDNTIVFDMLADGIQGNCKLQVTDALGNISDVLDIREFTVDTTSPVLTMVQQVSSPTNDTTPQYRFNSNEVGTIAYSGDCSSEDITASDGENWIDFTLTPAPVSAAETNYSGCSLTVTDAAGNTSLPLVVNDFTIDLLLPVVTEVTRIGTNPLYGSVDTTPDYTFNTDEAGTIVYGGTCSSTVANAIAFDNTITFNELSQGLHADCTISILDAAGNLSLPLSVSPFTIDSIAPVLIPVMQVAVVTGDNTPAFTFNSTEAGTITYSGDCSSTAPAVAGNNTIDFDVLADGIHSNCKLQVTDALGNISDVLDIRGFTVDTTPPVLQLDTPVKNPTNDITPQYRFISNEVGTIAYSGDCSSADVTASDGENWIDFTLAPAPVNAAETNYSGCSLTVTDAAGNTSLSLVVNDFTIDLLLPVVTEVTRIGTNPLYGSVDTTPDYTFNTDEAGTIVYGGSCSSVVAEAVVLDNTVTLNELSQGIHSDCTISILDAAGNLSLPLAVSPFTIDSIAPVLIPVTQVAVVTGDNTPAFTFNSTEAGTITYSGDCSSTTPAVAGDNTIEFDALADGAHGNCKLQVTDALGNISDILDIRSFTVDTAPPVLAVVKPVPASTNDTTPRFQFSSNEVGVIAYSGACSSADVTASDGENWIDFTLTPAPVDSAETPYSGCSLTVTDAAGNTSSSLLVNDFTIDLLLPIVTEVTRIGTNPLYGTTDTTPDYTFNTDEAGAIIYGGACSSSTAMAISGDNTIAFNDLRSGSYSDCTIQIRDIAGNTSSALAISVFTIDSIAPVLTVFAQVPTVTGDNTPAFTFSSTEAGTITYIGDCSSTASALAGNNTIDFDVLADGAHGNCKLRVTDALGNISDVLDIREFTVDTTPPVLSVDAPVKNPTNDITPQFRFISNEVGAISYSGACSSADVTASDGENWIDFILSPAPVDGVETPYSGCALTVTDAVGNTSSSLLVNSFTVDLQLPVVTEVTRIGTNPLFGTSDTTPDYTFNTDQAGAIIYGGACASSKTVAEAGNNTITFNDLRSGAYSNCTIQIRDIAGNTSSVLAVSDFTIDSLVPVLRQVVPVALVTPDNTPEYTFNSSEAGVISYTGDCSSLTSAANAGDNTITFNVLVDGSHGNCKIRVTDNQGNVSDVLDVREFTVDTQAPVLRVITPVMNPTNDDTPRYTFNSNEPGVITYSGSCSSVDVFANDGENWVDFNTLFPATYTDCGLAVTDAAGNTSSVLDVNDFTIEQTPPVVTEVTTIGSSNDPSPVYTFNTTEPGDIIYGGACSSSASVAVAGDNAIMLNDLRSGVYSDCTIRVRDVAGNISSPLVISSFTIDTLIPVLRQVSPIAVITGNNTPAYTFSSTEAGSITYTGDCTSATTMAMVGDNTINFDALSDGPHGNCRLRVTDADGNVSDYLEVKEFTVDTTAPLLRVAVPVVTPTNDDTPRYTFISNESGEITYSGDCSSTDTFANDGENWVDFNSLSLGIHSNCGLTVTDAAGNTSDILAINSFEIEQTAPILAEVTRIGTNPLYGSTDVSPNYTFSTTEEGAIIYGGSCSSSTVVANAGDNTVTFNDLRSATYTNCTVQVRDAAGNLSLALSVSSFTIDALEPVLRQVVPVAPMSNNTVPSYTFSSTESGTISYSGRCSSATVNASAGDNTITFNALTDGVYADCRLRVTDALGNVSDYLEVREFTVDTTAPVLRAVTPVADPTNDTTPRYTFISSESGVITYIDPACSSVDVFANDGENWVDFNTLLPATYNTCAITVTDSAGNTSAVLSVNDFTVELTAPVVTEVAAIGNTGDSTPSYTFDTTEAGSIIYGGLCSSSIAVAIAGNNTIILNDLRSATYSDCTVQVRDAAGNLSSVLTISTFTVDTLIPVLRTVAPIALITANNTPAYTFSSSEAGNITYAGDCTSATTAAVVGDNTITFDALSDGTHGNCRLRVTDTEGNASDYLEIREFTVDTKAPLLRVAVPIVTPTNDDTPRFTFISNESGVITYSGNCSSADTFANDGENWVDFNSLSLTTHSNCELTVTDAAGNTSAALAVNTFTIEQTAPTLSEVTPIGNTTDTTPAYTFNTNEAGSLVYGGGCTSSSSAAVAGNNTIVLDDLRSATYSNCTIQVRDAAGNVSSPLAISSFTIDSLVPVLRQVVPVALISNNTAPDYTFSSTEAGTISYSGNCSSVTSAASAGNNTITFNTLADGMHANCRIRVTDSFGNVSDFLDVREFTVDTTAPVLRVVTGVATPTNDTTPRYTFITNESGVITYSGSCSSVDVFANDGENWVDFNNLAPATTYTDCGLTVTDSAGNTSAILDVNDFTVDVVAPVISEISAIPTGSDRTPAYSFDSTKAGSILYSGSCSSSSSSAVALPASNTVIFNELNTGTYSNCTVQVRDAAGNLSNVLAVSAFTIDSSAPILRAITYVPLVTNDNTPDFTFSSTEDGTISYVGNCTSSTPGPFVGNITITFDALSDGMHSNCRLRITDAQGNASDYLDVREFTVDTTAPVLRVAVAVATPTNDTTPRYEFFSNESGVITYSGSCSSVDVFANDGDNWIDFSDLLAATYTDCGLTVTDSAGNTSAVLDVNDFTIEQTPPTVTEVTPIGNSNDATPAYTFNTTEAGTLIYGGGCTAPTETAVAGNNTINLNELRSGAYSTCTIQVRDAAGNVSSPLTLSAFTVDVLVPILRQVTPVALVTSDSTPDYTFSSSESGAISYSGNCSSVTAVASAGNNTITFNALADGMHANCRLRVTDAEGNTSDYLDVREFTVDTTAPVLRVVVPVTTPTNDTTPRYTFTSNESGTIAYSGDCSSVDTFANEGENWVDFNPLSLATHSNCELTVTDAAGNTSAALAVNTFTIEQTAPTLSEVTPIGNTTDTTPAYTFNTDEAGTLIYGGGCTSSTSAAVSGNNTIVLDDLRSATYSTCTIRVRDAAGNISPALAISAFTIDALVPILRQVVPVALVSNNTAPSYTFSSTEAGAISYSGNCSSVTAVASAGNNTITFNTLADGMHANCRIRVTDSFGNVSDFLDVREFTVDTTAPVLRVVTPVANPTNDTTPRYEFFSNESGVITYSGSCSSVDVFANDGDNWIDFSDLLAATYTDCGLTVTDSAGNTSAVLDVNDFTIEQTPPTVTEVTPIGNSNDATPAYTFNTTEAGTLIYGGGCTAPTETAVAGNNTINLNELRSGAYSTCTIQVRDAAGNVSSPLTLSAFTVDVLVPILRQVTPVALVTSDSTPDYTFSSSESGAISYSGNCSSVTAVASAGNNTITFNALADGMHANCRLRVTDAEGNTSDYLDVREFTVDTTAPVLRVVVPVTTPTNDTTPRYTFTSNESGTIAYSGDCSSVDTFANEGENWVDFNPLSLATHSNCELTVTDAAGNTSAALAVNTFTIEQTAPTLSEVTPIGNTTDTTPAYTFNTDEAGTLIYGGGCTSSTSAAVSGNNTIVLDDLRSATYSTCTIRVRDAAGNISPALAISAFTIDALVPILRQVVPVALVSNNTTPSYTFSSTEAGAISYSGNCSSVTAVASAGNNTITFNTLADGMHANCRIRVTDSFGNVSDFLDVREFTVDTTAPVLRVVTPVANPTNDTTPRYTFITNENGVITYSGACSSVDVFANDGENWVDFNNLVAGSYSGCDLTVTDAAGNESAPLVINDFTIDLTAPVITLGSSIGNSNDTTPPFSFTTDKAGTIVYGGSCSSGTTVATAGVNTVTFDELRSGSYSNCTVSVRDAAGNLSSPWAVAAFTVDAAAPIIRLVTNVALVTNDSTPDYTFSSTEDGTISYVGNCSSVTTSATAGNNTITFNALADGMHANCRFRVTDAQGNASDYLDVREFTVDTTAPVLRVAVAVATPTNDTTPRYEFFSNESGVITYSGACSSVDVFANDGDNWVDFSDLLAATYTDCGLTVTDSAGNTSAVLDVNDFTIEQTPPTVTEVTPIGNSNDATPAYTFNTTEAGTLIYGGGCTAPTETAVAGNNTINLNELRSGAYSTCTIQVRDVAGNVSSPLTLTAFTVDVAPPILRPVTFVALVTADSTPDYTFSSSESGAISYSGNCSSVTAVASAGNNTITFNALADGMHANCRLRVTDAEGNTSDYLDVREFTVDTTAPVLRVVVPVTTPTNDTTPRYTFTSNESGTIAYSGDCSSVDTFANEGENWVDFNPLSLATHSNCELTVTDAAGNTSAALAVNTFTIEQTAPTLSEVTPIGNTTDTTPAYTFNTDEAGTLIYGGGCTSSTSAAVSGNNTIVLDDLRSATYSTCTIRVRDAAGNISPALAISAFTIDALVPILRQVVPVALVSNNTTPSYTFSSTEAGAISYSGNCSSVTAVASAGNNTITFNTLADGMHANCRIRVTDSFGNVSDFLDVREFTVDTTAPVLRVVTPVANPTNDTTPRYTFITNENGVITYSGACSSVDVFANDGENWVDFNNLVAGSYSGCDLTVTDAAGNESAPLVINDFTIDLTAPVITLGSSIGNSNDTTPPFSFTTDKAGTIVYGGSCSSGTTVATAGVNTVTFDELRSGSYSNCTVSVRDAAGNLSSPWAVAAFTVDAAAPIIRLVTNVALVTNDSTPDYTFSSTEDGTISYVGNCSSVTTSATAGNNTITFNALADGMHANCRFRVTDAQGNASDYLDVREFTVDTAAPVLRVAVAVATPTNDTTPRYEFFSNESGVITYSGACSSVDVFANDGDNWVDFNTLLSATTYTDCGLTVTDSAGNTSAVLDVNDFTIDITVPVVTEVTTIGNSAIASPTYTFNTTKAGTIIYSGCEDIIRTAASGNNTVTFRALMDGIYSHCTIRVQDAAGNLSNVLNVSMFTVDTTAPDLNERVAVTTPSTNLTPSYTFSTTEAGSITYYGSCTSATSSAVQGLNTVTFNALTVGTYSNCRITVTDIVGNISPLLVVTPFVVTDGVPPVLAEVTPVVVSGFDATPDYTFSSNEMGTITYGGNCSSSTSTAFAGNNTVTFYTLAAATHSNCTITVTDSSGNASTPLAVTAFTVVMPKPLNDTGITLCGDFAAVTHNNDVDCAVAGATQTVAGTSGGDPVPAAQDALFGRDSNPIFNSSVDGYQGFSFTKLNPAGNPLPDAAVSWSCLQDGVTGLVWENATTSGLTWAAAALHVTTVNGAGLCGANDWRLPTPEELLSIVNHGATSPSIDAIAFPGTISGNYWTSMADQATPANVWVVDFALGIDGSFPNTNIYSVRLVRDAP